MSTYPSRQNTTLPRSPQSQDLLVPNPKLRLREPAFAWLRRGKHYWVRTEETYWGWIRPFIFFHDKRHPREMAA